MSFHNNDNWRPHLVSYYNIISKSIYCKAVHKTQDSHFCKLQKKLQTLKGFLLLEIWKKMNVIISELTKNRTALLNPSFTCISKSFILVPCWRSWLLSSFRSFCTNSAAALFFWVRREAQIALYSIVLSSLGFPLGLSITPTRTPGLAFCAHTHTHKHSRDIIHTKITHSHISTDCRCHWGRALGGESVDCLKATAKVSPILQGIFFSQIQNACLLVFMLFVKARTQKMHFLSKFT